MSHSGWSTSNYISALAGSIPTAVPLTIHVRYKPASAGSSAYVVGLSDGTTTNEFFLRVNAGGAPVAGTSAASTVAATGATSLSSGTWYSLVARFSAINSRLIYVDGVQDGSNTSSRTPTGISNARVGVRGNVSGAALGSLAEVAIWNVALSTDDIAALATVSPLLIRPDVLVCYIPLLDSDTLDLVAPAATVTGTLTKDNDHPRVILPRQRSIIIPKSAGGGGATAYTADLTAGSFSVTGSSLSVPTARNVALTAGSFAVTGSSVSVPTARNAALTAGSFAVTGSDLTVSTARNAALSAGSFAVTGSDLTVPTARNAALDPGAFTITGSDVDAVVVQTIDYTVDLLPGVFTLTGSSIDVALTDARPGPASDRAARRKRRDRETLEAYYAALQRKANEDAEREKLEALAEAERALEEAENAKKAEAKRAAVRKVFAALDRAALTEKAKAGAREAEQAALEAIAKRQTDEQRQAYLDALDQLNVEIEFIGAQIARLYARRREEEQFLLQRWFAA